MVFLSRILFYAQKIEQIESKPVRKYLRRGFLDYINLYVKAGSGGSGLPRYGGKGGRGGHVFLQASDRLTLVHVSKVTRNRNWHADPGTNSSPCGLIGAVGNDLIISVPTGVTVHDDNGIIIGELNESFAKLKVAEGGLGGCKETDYCGRKGQARRIHLDLKLMSDIALVGFPNAGKSTLLRGISRAAPKVAEYPFTTVKPNIGIMQFPDLRTITVGDLPGLIEGAHMNVGMGCKFLKHIERSKMLLFVVDIQGFQLSRKHPFRSCLETIVLLNKEIELYKPDLLEMPSMLLLNKMDTPGADDTVKSILEKVKRLDQFLSEFPEEIRPTNVVSFQDILQVSLLNMSKSENNLMKNRIRYILDKCTSSEEFEKQPVDPVIKLIGNLKKEEKQVAPILV